ncbi:MAG: CBS domain-containing protein [Burkholderiales bacterium]|jgi:CBS domain-containing protein|nr:CBS domain-containing protein [Burkholderiales bacterium]
MKVSDILRVKGDSPLFSIDPSESLSHAVDTMATKDMGSLLVMDSGRLVGLLTFREVIMALHRHGGVLGGATVQSAMDSSPLTCSSDHEIDEVRHMMLTSHSRYIPVLDGAHLKGVISFYDVAKAVLDSHNFENKMLKAYIRDWPNEDPDTTEQPSTR